MWVILVSHSWMSYYLYWSCLTLSSLIWMYGIITVVSILALTDETFLSLICSWASAILSLAFCASMYYLFLMHLLMYSFIILLGRGGSYMMVSRWGQSASDREWLRTLLRFISDIYIWIINDCAQYFKHIIKMWCQYFYCWIFLMKC